MTARALLGFLLLVASPAFARNEKQILRPGAIETATAGNSVILGLFTKSTPPNYPGGEIEAMRIDFDGDVITTPFRIAQSFSLQINPAAAFDGANFLVVWDELGDPPLLGRPRPGRVTGAFVPESGAPSQSFTIADASPIAPVIVWDGTRYFVFYSDVQSRAMGVTVSAQGVIGTPFAIGDAEKVVAAAAGNSQIEVLAVRSGKLVLSTVDSSLQVSPSRVIASGANEACIAWNGEAFLILWTDPNGVWARATDNIYELHAVSSTVGYHPQLVASGSLFVAGWDAYGGAVAWIGLDPFRVEPSGVGGDYPILVPIPGRGIAMFFTRSIYANQFYTEVDQYMTYVTPSRQRPLRSIF